MKDNSNDTSVTNGNGNPVLPLYDFFIVLKQNGFSVSPKQVADCNRVINAYAQQVQNEDELCAYLSAVMANSKEEQVQFREIFTAFYKQELPQAPPPPPACPRRLIKHIKANILSYLSILLALLLALTVIYLSNRMPALPVITIDAYQADSVTNGRADAVLLSSDTSNRFALHTLYDWGDGTAADSLPWHIYKADGSYRVKANVTVMYKNRLIDTVMATDLVNICVQRPVLNITGTPPGGEVLVGTAINFSAGVQAANENDINWTAAGDTVEKKGRGRNFTVAFSNTGRHTVYCTFSHAGAFCTAEKSVIIFVKDSVPHPPVVLAAAPGAKDAAPGYSVKPYWYYLTAALALISLFFTIFFAVKWNKAKGNITPLDPEAEREYQKLIVSLGGQLGKRELVFTGKNYLPLPEKELSDVARMMRMRINDETPFIDIQKTIGKAVAQAGFFQPVYSTRTQQCEYLVLIDDIGVNSQQVKLFEYLLDLLVKQNVFIERFYYRRSPADCYNTEMPHGISLEKLSEKFPRHVLLIMGNAYQLLYDIYPVVDNSFLPLLHRWPHRAILTPVSFADWGNKEKMALYEAMPMVPVDIQGQILLMKKLFAEEVNVIATLHQNSRDFYEAESVDFEDIDELYEYCEQADWANEHTGSYGNLLFQWIAALATWPKINWEITLAVGKALLDKHGKTNELNFTSLLRIARIKWMKEGRFPDYIRTALLKKLSRENEITARETILVLLNEIPEAELQRDHFAFEEKETQRMINEFILYAYDPVKYAAYKRSKNVFGKMNAKGEVMDQALLHYLENPGFKWETLIHAPVRPGHGENSKPETLTGYFTAESGFLKKVFLWCTALSAIVFLSSLLGLIGLMVIGTSGTGNFPYFTTADPTVKNISFTVSLPSAGKTRSAADTILTVDTASVILNGRSVYSVPVVITDSLTAINISVDGNTLYDTAININKDAYTLSSLPIHNDTTGQLSPPVVPADTVKGGPDTSQAPPATVKPVVYIEVSDKSLTGSANQFRKELAARGDLDVKAVTVKQYNYNSEITYYTAGMQATASRIRQYYNRYYPDMTVQARLRRPGAESNKNNIVVWIQKLDNSNISQPAPVYRVQNEKIPPTIRQGSNLSVAFEIAATGGATASQQQSGSINGTVCINSENICTSFYSKRFTSGSRMMTEQLNTKDLAPGKYLVNITIPEFNINQVIGTFTVEGNRPPSSRCDTISSVISRGQGDISKSYYHPDMQRLGILMELMELDNKKENALLVVQKEGCRQEKIQLYARKMQTVTFCDGSKLTLQLKRFRSNQKAEYGSEITFDAIYCQEINYNNRNPAIQMKN